MNTIKASFAIAAFVALVGAAGGARADCITNGTCPGQTYQTLHNPNAVQTPPATTQAAAPVAPNTGTMTTNKTVTPPVKKCPRVDRPC